MEAAVNCINTIWPFLGPVLLLGALVFIIKCGRDLWRETRTDLDEWVHAQHQAALKRKED